MTADRKINALDAVVSGNTLVQDRYIVFPPRSLSNHIGFGDGVHCTVKMTDYVSDLSGGPVTVVRPQEIAEDPQIVRRFHRWLLRVHFKLLFKYIVTLGPIRNRIKVKQKNREF